MNRPARAQPLLDGRDPSTDRLGTLVEGQQLRGELVALFLSFGDAGSQLASLEPSSRRDTLGKPTAR